MPYKMIATDLDDTLLDGDYALSERTKTAVRQAVKAGVHFVIATGRMFKTSVDFLHELGFDGDMPLISHHGAIVKKSKSETLIFSRPIANKTAVAVAETAEGCGCHVNVFVDDEVYIREKTEHSSFYQSATGVELKVVGPLTPFLKNSGLEPSKMNIVTHEEERDSLKLMLQKEFNPGLAILPWGSRYIEITDKEASKGQALHWLAETKNIRREEIIAFGDGHNDLDMIAYAGLGVAVANAQAEVLKAADLIADPNTEDGVAKVIERYVLGR